MPTPLEILTSDGTRVPSVMERIWAPFIGSVLGFGCACFINIGMRRPLFSGIQKHAGLSGIGVVIATYVEGKRQLYLAERDAVLRHYIELHPEDFIAPERKKFANVLESWVPIR